MDHLNPVFSVLFHYYSFHFSLLFQRIFPKKIATCMENLLEEVKELPKELLLPEKSCHGQAHGTLLLLLNHVHQLQWT